MKPTIRFIWKVGGFAALEIGGDIAAIDALDTGIRGGPEPDQITLETFGRPIPEA